MTDYTRIINDIFPLHDDESGKLEDSDVSVNLILNVATRQITPGNNFSTLIGTTDDINTNIITFSLTNIETADNHNLLKCDNKILKWQNQASKDIGTSNLSTKEVDGETYLQWLVPVEVLAMAGSIKISLCFYDIHENSVVYRWNSLPYTGLTVAQGMDEISTELVPLDEIITLDMRTRKIAVPSALNREVGKQGETVLTTLRFRCDRYYQEQDFATAEVRIYWKYQNSTTINLATITNPDNSLRIIGEKLIEFDWHIPQNIKNQAGSFEFSVCLILSESPARIWYSDTCSGFYVGETLIDEAMVPPVDSGDAELYIVNGDILDQTLTNILENDNAVAPTEAMTVSDAIAYSITRFMEADVTIDGGNADDYIEE